MAFTTAQADKVNRANPVYQEAAVGTEVYNLGNYSPIILTASITADATAGKAITVPFAVEIIEMTAQCRADSAGGTVKLTNGSADIVEAIAMETDKAVTRGAVTDDSKSSLAAGATLLAVAGQAGDKGLVSVYCRRV